MAENNQVRKFIVNDSMSIRDVIIHMNNRKIDFVICRNLKNKKIQGVFTEGDFRRLIFKGYDINDNIKTFTKKNFKFLEKNYKILDAQKKFNKYKINYLPVIVKNQVVEILNRKNFIQEEEGKKIVPLDNEVIVMAGGKGTRMDPFTRFLPKALLPIGDDPVIDIILNNFYQSGIKKITLSLFDKSEMIKAHFNKKKHPYKVSFIEEKIPMGTIGSISLFGKKLKQPFFVINCDVLVDVNYNDIISFHKKNKHSITLIASLQRSIIPYGVCKIDKRGQLVEFREKPSSDNLVITGLYLMNPDVIKMIPKNKALDVPDLINKLKKKGAKVGVYPISENSFNDVGNWDVYEKTLSHFNNHKK